ncbi:MAG: RNA polymerase sigma factor [Bacteroidota bacterium]
MQEHQLIKSCLKGEASGYNTLYAQYAPKMLVLCSRYVTDFDDAKDLLQEGFIKVFEELHRFRNEGSLEGWIRRIMVNEALNNYKKVSKIQHQTDDIGVVHHEIPCESIVDVESQLNNKELLALVQTLPPSYRMVFNLYVFEGYKHQEIAKKLGIGEGTSKSNLQDARRLLQLKINTINKEAKTRLK